MLSCWREHPDERPKFSEVVQRLEELLGVTAADVKVSVGESDGYLAPREDEPPKESFSVNNPDYITLLNTEAPAPYGSEEGYLSMDGATA